MTWWRAVSFFYSATIVVGTPSGPVGCDPWTVDRVMRVVVARSGVRWLLSDPFRDPALGFPRFWGPIRIGQSWATGRSVKA